MRSSSSHLKRSTSLLAFIPLLFAPLVAVAQTAISPAIPAKPKPIILVQPARTTGAAQNQLVATPSVAGSIGTSIDADYWPNRLSAARQEAADLAVSIGELRRQIKALSGDSLREEIVQNQVFVAELQQLRKQADRWIAPELVQAMEWSARNAGESGEILKRKLERQQIESAAKLPALQAQLDAKQVTVSRNSDLQGVLSGIIEAQRSGYDLESKISELKALDADDPAKAAPAKPEAHSNKF